MAVVRQLVLAESLEYYFGVLVSLLAIAIFQPKKDREYQKYYLSTTLMISVVKLPLYLATRDVSLAVRHFHHQVAYFVFDHLFGHDQLDLERL